MKKILIIAYYFPPLAGPGVVKVLRNCRYLPKFGWWPVVVSVSNPEKYAIADNSIPNGVVVERAVRLPGFDLICRILDKVRIGRQLIAIPDAFIAWIPGALIKGIKVIKVNRPNLIYTTIPPYSSAIVAALLAKWRKLPLIVDIRDPWLDKTYPLLRYPTKFHRYINEILERCIIKQAKCITFIYKIALDQYLHRYTYFSEKFILLRPGFDGSEIIKKQKKRSNSTSIKILYSGVFYPPYKAIMLFFRGLSKYNSENQEKAFFIYYGQPFELLNKFAREAKIERFMTQKGYVPMNDVIRAQAASDILLLVLEFSTIPTKLYEYLASGVPLLIIAPEISELKWLLDRYSSAYVYLSLDAKSCEVVQAISYLKSIKLEQKEIDVKTQVLWNELEISVLTEKLAKIFNDATH